MHTAPALRPYQPSDLTSVIAIFLSAIRESAVKDYDPAQIDAWAQVDRQRWENRRLSRPTWVAVVDAEIVGFTDLEPDGLLDMIYVRPAYQRMGVASLLLQQVETTARLWGLSRVFTMASLTARPLFERRGFQVLAQQQATIGGQSLIHFCMQKTLADSRFELPPATEFALACLCSQQTVWTPQTRARFTPSTPANSQH